MTKQAENKDEEEYKKIKKIIQKKENGDYNFPYIFRNLHDKETLRKTFLSIISKEPARISEISEEALLSKTTCYSQLYKLIELKLVDRIYVMSVMNGTIINEDIKNKFIKWTENMPESLKRYYLAKTSYWVVTNYGQKFGVKAYEFEQEFRKKELKEIEEKDG